VSACAVLPVVDDIRGQVFVALVEADNCQELQQSLLLDLRQRVGSLKAPRRIICVERLPLLASGKPDLKAAEALVHAL